MTLNLRSEEREEKKKERIKSFRFWHENFSGILGFDCKDGTMRGNS